MEENNTEISEQKEQLDQQAPEQAAQEQPAAEQPAQKPQKNRKSFFRGIALGVVLSLFAVSILTVLYRGYIAVPFGKYGTFTVKFPYYEALHNSDSGMPDKVEFNRKLDEVENLVKSGYLYDADGKAISDGMFSGFVYGLTDDKYAYYYSPETFENETLRLFGSYVGIGVQVSKDEKTGGVLVESLLMNGSAKEAGIKVGDIILKADGQDLTALELDQCTSLIKGEEGTNVVLTIMRGDQTFEQSVERRTIMDISVNGSMIPNTPIGYISITGFTQETEKEFYSVTDELINNQEAEGLVIDLRNNGGGDMNVALRMIDSLLADDLAVVRLSEDADEKAAAEANAEAGKTLLLTIESKDGKVEKYFSDDEVQERVPIAVVVNGNSASASEIFAGVLKSYGYDVVGTKTFGKGIVQSLYELDDGSAIKFTTEQYRLPDGELIHGKGVEPTSVVEFEDFDGISSDMVNYANGEETDLKKDVQISAAKDLLMEEIYGGH